MADFRRKPGDPCPVCNGAVQQVLVGQRTEAGLVVRYLPCDHTTPWPPGPGVVESQFDLPRHPEAAYSLDRVDAAATECSWDGTIWRHTQACADLVDPCVNIGDALRRGRRSA